MNFPSGISFIITLYNKESFIVDTLESVFKYLKKNNQLIIIDDGSTDKSLEYVKRALQQKNNIDYKVITQENTGPSVAINNCIRYIKYSHVKFLDGDDVLSPNISTFMKNEMDTHNLDLMYGHWIWKSNHTKYKFNTRRYPTKIFKLNLLTYWRKNFIVNIENINAKNIEKKSRIETERSPDVKRLFKPYIVITPKTGIDNKKEIFEASYLLKFWNLLAVIVIPILLTPGIKDKIWNNPINNADL